MSTETHPVKLQLLELPSGKERLAFALENFSALRKKPNTRGGGKTMAGLKHLEGKDYGRIASKLLETEWSGQYSVSALMIMAREVRDLLRIKDMSDDDIWAMGRVLVSALCYAGIYRQDQEARGAVGGRQRPLYLVRVDRKLKGGKRPVKRTQHHPFPEWTGPTDDSGNRLVRPSHPCPPESEYEPTIADQPWVQAVHRLESIPFRINKALLRIVINLDTNPETRIIPYLPPNYEQDKAAQDEEYDRLGISRMQQLRDKDKELRKKDDKENEERAKQELEPIRSEGYHTTPDEDASWSEYWIKENALEDKKQRYEARRLQFERQVETAKTLLKAGKPFYQRVSVDYRGRLYLPDFSYQGSDFCRAVIEFDKADVVSKSGWKHLIRHTANTYGEAKTFDEKIAFRLGDSTTSKYIDIALDPLKHFDDWKDADKPFCFLRSCIEVMDVATPRLKGILDGDDPDELKHYSGQTTLPKAKEWFRRVASRYSVLKLREVDERWEGDFYSAPDHRHYLSHLPCEIDQSNSAFQHIAQMMNRRDKYEEVLGADVYLTVAEKLPEELFSGLDSEGDKRKLVKLVAIPWSYGAGLDSVTKRVEKYRKENPDKVRSLEGLSPSDIRTLCANVIRQLNGEYPLCGEYQAAIGDAVDEVKDTGKYDYIEWDTPLGFVAHQRVHKIKSKEDLVYTGDVYYETTGKKKKDGEDMLKKQGGDREVRANLALEGINWSRMRTKAPPNFIHSYDAALVHGTLWSGKFGMSEVASKRIVKGNPYFDNPNYAGLFPDDWSPEDVTDEFRFPVVTIHDAFACLASHCDEVIDALQHNFEQIYQGFDPLQRFLNSVRTGSYPLRHRDYEWEPNPDQFS